MFLLVPMVTVALILPTWGGRDQRKFHRAEWVAVCQSFATGSDDVASNPLIEWEKGRTMGCNLTDYPGLEDCTNYNTPPFSSHDVTYWNVLPIQFINHTSHCCLVDLIHTVWIDECQHSCIHVCINTHANKQLHRHTCTHTYIKKHLNP